MEGERKDGCFVLFCFLKVFSSSFCKETRFGGQAAIIGVSEKKSEPDKEVC